VKTERMNRNTIHGKTARPKPKPAKKAAQNSNLTAEETISVAAPRPRRDPGPRTLNPEIAAYLEERARAGKCKQTLAEECDHLYAWAKKTYALEIRTKARKLAGRKRLREAHSKAYYRLNPEFDRLRRFKQEST